MTVFPFVFLRTADLKNNQVLMNHERIHIRQQIEMLVIPFYIWYLTEFLIKSLKYLSVEQGYRNISFEREAYQKEADFNYISKRKFWAWIRFV